MPVSREGGLVQGIQSDGGSLEDGFKVRLEAMGLSSYKPVRLIRSALFGGPLQVRVGSTTEIAIRRSEAQLVTVTTETEHEIAIRRSETQLLNVN